MTNYRQITEEEWDRYRRWEEAFTTLVDLSFGRMLRDLQKSRSNDTLKRKVAYSKGRK